jgi:hypothetical protein
MSVRTPLSVCTSCGAPNTAADDMRKGKVVPVPGDITICLYCGHLQAVADDLTRRDLTPAEIIEIAGRQDIVAMQNTRLELAESDPDWPVKDGKYVGRKT